jgi:hypothetical protein
LEVWYVCFSVHPTQKKAAGKVTGNVFRQWFGSGRSGSADSPSSPQHIHQVAQFLFDGARNKVKADNWTGAVALASVARTWLGWISLATPIGSNYQLMVLAWFTIVITTTHR